MDESALPKGFSARSVRRRVRNVVSGHLVNLTDVSAESGSQKEETVNSDLNLCTIENEMSWPVTETGRELAVDVELAEVYDDTDKFSDVSMDTELLTADSEGSGDSSVEDSDTESLGVSVSVMLAEWAVQNNITMSALRSLLAILRPFHADLPADPRALLKTPRNYSFRKISNEEGMYYHFGISSGIDIAKCPDGPLFLQFNIDGLPLFKSSSVDLWPILCYVNGSQLQPFVVGLYCGRKKPSDIFEYLEEFVTDLNNVLANGVSDGNKCRYVVLDCFVCDAPARAYIKNVKSFSGYYGCDKCVQEGEYVEGKVTFPLTDAPKRSDEDFAQQRNEEHHNGSTPLSRLPFGLVSGFVIDYMHSVCLGVMRRLLHFWLRGPIRSDSSCAGRLSSGMVAAVSHRLQHLSKFVPREFARKPRTLLEVDRWKATEFRQLLLYTGHVVFYGVLSEVVLNHFRLLAIGISVLCNPTFCVRYNEYAHQLLTVFVEQCASIYGRGFMVYNVHSLVHLSADVQLHGSLDNFSAFRFENQLKQLKGMVRKAALPLPQIVRRITEKRRTGIRLNENHIDVNKEAVKNEHCSGPVPLHFSGAKQYSMFTKAEFVIAVYSTGDCCILVDHEKPMIVRNILLYKSKYFFVCETFHSITDLFMHPLPSSALNMYLVSGLSANTVVVPATGNIVKCACLPLLCEKNSESNFAVFPLLHICSQ